MRRDGAANRERILLAAEHVFGAGGTDASTEEVARRAEVGVATVFRHFPTKRALVEAAAVRHLEKLEEQTRLHLDRDDPGAALASVIRILVATGPTKVTLLNRLLAGGDGLGEPVLVSVARIRDEVGRLLGRARDAGAVRADATTEQVFTLARALAHVTPHGHGADGATDQALEIVLDGLCVTR